MAMQSLSRRDFVAAAAAATAGRSLGANDRVNFGMIGTGGRGSDHIRELIRLKESNVAITATCDLYRPNLARGAALVEQGFGAAPRTTKDYRELLGWKDVDAVVIATPDFAHPLLLMAALEAGKDVYVEKPFAVNFQDAKAAYLAAKSSRQVVAAGTNMRSDPRLIAASKLARTGVLGKLTRVEFAVNFNQPRWRRPNERVDPADVDWELYKMGRIDRPYDPRLLREWQLFAGITTNGIPGLWMSHYIDLVPWFTGEDYPAGAVSAGGVYLWKDGRTTSDVFYSLLDYPSEFVVMFTMSLTNSSGARNAWYGTRGTLDCQQWLLSGQGGSPQDRIEGETKIEPQTGTSHMADFIDCVRTRRKPRADAQAGFSHAVAGILSAEALLRGSRVRFDRQKLEIL
ncbi:MAG: Gfo/Idh/MocA family protein [Bryobacteraceae bacterium]